MKPEAQNVLRRVSVFVSQLKYTSNLNKKPHTTSSFISLLSREHPSTK